MSVGAVPASDFFSNSFSLASGFESAALGDAEIPNVLYVLGSSNESALYYITNLRTLLPLYRQAAADGDRDRMQQLGSLIAKSIREHASVFDRLLATSPSGSRRFGSVAEVRATLTTEGAAETPATVALVSAAQYLQELKDREGEPVDFSVPEPPDTLEQRLIVPLSMFALICSAMGFALDSSVPGGVFLKYSLAAIGLGLLGFKGLEFLTLRESRRYIRLNPPALYQNGEVMAPTLARFKQGAVPLYPVATQKDIYSLPVGSHVLLKNKPIRRITIHKDNLRVSCLLDFSGKDDQDGRFAYYDAKDKEETEAVAKALGQGNVTFVGTITEEKKFGIRDIKVVRILTDPPKTK